LTDATTDDVVRTILESSTTVATVGASTDGSKPSGSVPRYLKEIGFKVTPVNPNADEIFGERAYAKLADIPQKVDVVQVFRPAEEVPEIAREAVAIGAKALWLQLDIISDEARRIAEAAGLAFVQDRCMEKESRRLNISKEPAA
jgi:hypothetical protein